jgi:glycosyl transferase family 1
MQSVPQLRLIIAGEGPQRGELQELAASLGSHVKFVGHVGRAERDAMIAQSRFTVLPSPAYETLGKTILESYAKGRAVVASDLGSRRELVHDSETGLLYRTGDVNQIASVIQSLGSAPELAEKMGRALALLDAMGAGLVRADERCSGKSRSGRWSRIYIPARERSGSGRPATLSNGESRGAGGRWENGEEADRRAVSVAEGCRRHCERVLQNTGNGTGGDAGQEAQREGCSRRRERRDGTEGRVSRTAVEVTK